MTRKLITLLTALMLALSGAAFTACGSDDRPESEDIERSAEEAGEAAGEAAEDAGDAAQDAGNAAEDATDDGG